MATTHHSSASSNNADKYEGPHSGFGSTCDSKIEDFYVNTEVEHLDNKNDDQTTVDAKFKHSKGFVRYKLHLSTPKVDGAYKLQIKDNAQARFNHNSTQTQVEFKNNDVYEEMDFGSYGLARGKLWINPYYRWESLRDFSKNSLRVGGVFRYNDLLLRAQLRLNNLMENDKHIGSTALDTKGHYQRNEFTFQWFKAFNLCNRALENWKILTGYENSTYGALVHASQKGSDQVKAGLYLLYKSNKNVSFGTKYTHTVNNDKPHSAIVGMQYVPDRETTIRTTLDCKLDLKTFFSHKLNNNCSLLLNFRTNFNQFLPNAPKYADGYMGYPLNYGCVFKVNA